MPKVEQMKTMSHKARFERWKNRFSKQMQYLCELVDTKLVPAIESHGFCRVEICLQKDDDIVSANEIRLERIIGVNIDSIYIRFDKYGRVKFQIGFYRKSLNLLNEFVRSRHLVMSANQYYFWWGKPWWAPEILWSENNSKRAISELIPILPQILEFLERGQCGKNISKEV
jgi:hypothetical protein